VSVPPSLSIGEGRDRGPIRGDSQSIGTEQRADVDEADTSVQYVARYTLLLR